MFLRLVTLAPGGGGGPASALRMPPTDRLPRPARLPAARPERRRNVRRSRLLPVEPARVAASVPRRACRSDLRMATCPPSGSRIAIDPVEVLNFRRIRLVAGLALFRDGLALGRGCRGRERHRSH